MYSSGDSLGTQPNLIYLGIGRRQAVVLLGEFGENGQVNGYTTAGGRYQIGRRSLIRRLETFIQIRYII